MQNNVVQAMFFATNGFTIGTTLSNQYRCTAQQSVPLYSSTISTGRSIHQGAIFGGMLYQTLQHSFVTKEKDKDMRLPKFV